MDNLFGFGMRAACPSQFENIRSTWYDIAVKVPDGTRDLFCCLPLDKNSNGAAITMMFSHGPLHWLRTRQFQTARLSNPVAVGIGSFLMLVAGGVLCGCDSQQDAAPAPIDGAVDNGAVDDATELTEDQTAGIAEEPVMEDADGQLLRHAVFFSFNEESTEQDIASVTTAFAALPEKIDSIIDFQWGTNNSPENHDDGFTHGFLLTFKDEAGREIYLPHPAHTGEFADKLKPHMKDVFVIDYWGKPQQNEIKKELKHAVFFKFKDDADPAAVQQVEQAFAALPDKIDSIKAFEWGTNNSPESHDDGFTHCFMVTFDSEQGREVYLPHPDHLAFVEVLKPVLDKVRVVDFWAQ